MFLEKRMTGALAGGWLVSGWWRLAGRVWLVVSASSVFSNSFSGKFSFRKLATTLFSIKLATLISLVHFINVTDDNVVFASSSIVPRGFTSSEKYPSFSYVIK